MDAAGWGAFTREGRRARGNRSIVLKLACRESAIKAGEVRVLVKTPLKQHLSGVHRTGLK